ncbi:Hypothetical protein A7982_03067 [Minicystis rosea]|nr:Hypothetical protein A7982_03067 [Minicystis rosea]
MQSFERADLVPFQGTMPSGMPPLVSRLALIGAPSPRIGSPITAASNLDVQGFGIFKNDQLLQGDDAGAALKRKNGILMGSILAVLFGFPGVLFGSEVAAVIGALVGGAIGFFVFGWLFGPDRDGKSIIVGTEGFQIGTSSSGTLRLEVFRYDDPSVVWIEGKVNDYVVFSSGPHDVSNREANQVRHTLAVYDRASWAERGSHFVSYTPAALREGFPITPTTTPGDRWWNEWIRGFFMAIERGIAVRVAMAERARSAGQPVVFPAKASSRQIICGPHHFEMRNGNIVELAAPWASLGVAVEKGIYSFSADGRSARVPRDEIGDVLVLERVFLKDVRR